MEDSSDIRYRGKVSTSRNEHDLFKFVSHEPKKDISMGFPAVLLFFWTALESFNQVPLKLLAGFTQL
jgi:hypothetical protein